MSNRQELANELERLEKETTMSLAIADPVKFKSNNAKIKRISKQFIKVCNK